MGQKVAIFDPLKISQSNTHQTQYKLLNGGLKETKNENEVHTYFKRVIQIRMCTNVFIGIKKTKSLKLEFQHFSPNHALKQTTKYNVD